MLHTHKNLKYLHKKQKESKFAFIVYENLNDEIIDTYGASQDYLKKLNLRIEIALEDDETMQEIKQADLQVLEQKKVENLSIEQSIIEIVNKIGHFNEKEMSVRQFYNHINQLKK